MGQKSLPVTFLHQFPKKKAYYLAAGIQDLRAQSSMHLVGGELGQTDQGGMTWHVTFRRLFIIPTNLSGANPNLLTYLLVLFPGLS